MEMTRTRPTIDMSETSIKNKFLLQSSLTHHLARRSVNIRFWCRFCAIEIQFFNRCVLLKHLRAHSISIENVDTTCITFSPIAKDLIDKGLVTTFFKDCTSNSNFPRDEPIPQKTNGPQFEDSSRISNNDSIANERAFSVTTVNSNQLRFSTVAGQSKSVCFQTNTSVLLNKPICSTAPTSHSAKTIITPKSQQIPVVQTVQKQTKDLSQVNNKSSPKSFTSLSEQMPRLVNAKQNAQIKTIYPNIVCELGSKKADFNDVIDESKKTNNFEEEERHIVNLTDDSNPCNDDFTKGSSSENRKSKKSNKMKEVCISSGSSKSLKRYCTECGIACLNISKHLNSDNRPSNPELTCEVCQLILPTQCALKIHLRIHMKMPPYKCPDCGKDFVSWDDLHSHLKFSCGHLAKCVRHLCVSCKAHFPSTTVLSQHIITKHSRKIFKCCSCTVAFFNKQSLLKHFVTQHPKETFIEGDHRQCSMCPGNIVPYDTHLIHVQAHTRNPNSMIYGYKCPMCLVVFANKMPFIIHQIKEKGDLDARDSNKNKNKNIVSSKNTSSVNQCFESTEISAQVSDSNSDVEEEPEIIRKNIDEISFVTEKDPLSLEGWDNEEQRIKEKREELCIVCKKNYVYLLPGINLNDQSLCCKQCVKPLDENSTKIQIDDIQGFRYFMNNACRNSVEIARIHKRSSPKSIQQRSSSFDETKIALGKRRVSDVSLNDGAQESGMYMELDSDCAPTKKKSRKKHIKGNIDLSSQAHIQGQVITSKSLDELICSKCEFIADTREVFLDHIITHRSDPNSFQCLECGLCFVVLPSLERHLQMHHGIKDINNYIENNRSSLPQKVIMIEQDADDNQCRVCYKVFDSLSSLDKHFRTHGMAFMSRLGKSP